MKKIITILFFTLLYSSANSIAQTVFYTHDQDGNMTQRKVLIVGPAQASAKETIPIYDEIGEQKVTIYPNPTRGHFQVELTLIDEKLKNYFVIYSLSGTKIQQNKISNLLTDINISNFPSGTYLLDIFLGEMVSRWKVIKL
ncbi:MAG TPA: T9SS type A sorting domain-containing protein [Bacteroidales bacterium]|nr:T9SS type A sorting domain-containing protein [Bacteroidales bacterium]